MRRDDRSGESCACFDVSYANIELSRLRLGRSWCPAAPAHRDDAMTSCTGGSRGRFRWLAGGQTVRTTRGALLRACSTSSNASLEEVLQALDDSPWPADRAGSQKCQPTSQLPRRTPRTKRSGAHRRRAARPDDPRPTSQGSAPNDHRQRRIPNNRSGCLLGEDQRPGAGARIAQTRDHHIAHGGSGRTRPGPRAGLPQIELADLAGPIDRALKRPRRLRTAAAPRAGSHRRSSCRPRPQRLDQLADPLARQPRILAQQPVDLVLERIQL